MPTIFMHSAYKSGAKPLPPLVKCTQVLKEIMLQYARDPHQRVRVNPAAGIDLVDVVPVAVQLLRQPRHLDPLAGNNLFDQLAYMGVLFLHGHKKIVSLFCAARRSGHLYHKQLSPRFSSQANRPFLVVLLKIVQIFVLLKKAKSLYINILKSQILSYNLSFFVNNSLKYRCKNTFFRNMRIYDFPNVVETQNFCVSTTPSHSPSS